MRIILVLFCLFSILSTKAQDSILVKTENVFEKYNCFCSKSNKQGLIRNIAEAKANLEVCYSPRKCRTTSIDSLLTDLSTQDIIFLSFSGGGNYPPVYTKFYYKIPKQKKYLLLIKLKKKTGMDERLGTHIFIRELVPKLEPGYSFEYKVEEVEVTK